MATSHGLTSPGGWGPAVATAAAHRCQWLVLPVCREEAAGLGWVALAAACASEGIGVWAPFRMAPMLEVARLGRWLGVPAGVGHGCTSWPPCGACDGCSRLARVRAAVGGDPRSASG
ncbi:MAG: hypothetical protein VKS61_08085 [Candidatus Sericytochromatia bacterium]|nr:hypothetical protein [Candidatus Sericytochromatia bacterium]